MRFIVTVIRKPLGPGAGRINAVDLPFKVGKGVGTFAAKRRFSYEVQFAHQRGWKCHVPGATRTQPLSRLLPLAQPPQLCTVPDTNKSPDTQWTVSSTLRSLPLPSVGYRHTFRWSARATRRCGRLFSHLQVLIHSVELLKTMAPLSREALLPLHQAQSASPSGPLLQQEQNSQSPAP